MLPSQPPVELDCFIGLPSKDTKLTFRTDLATFGFIVDCLQEVYKQCQQCPAYVTVKGQHLWSSHETSEALVYGASMKEVNARMGREDTRCDGQR